MLRRDDCALIEQGDGALGHLPAGWNMYRRSDGHYICAPIDDFEQRTRPWSFRHLAKGEAWAAISDRTRIPTDPIDRAVSPPDDQNRSRAPRRPAADRRAPGGVVMDHRTDARSSAMLWRSGGATFNAWLGCQRVSPACENCYAETDVLNKSGRKPPAAEADDRRLTRVTALRGTVRVAATVAPTQSGPPGIAR